MSPDVKEINRSLQLLFQPGETIELRCLGDKTINGYFRDPDKLAQEAQRVNQFQPPINCYVVLNPISPLLYGKRAEQIGIAKKGGGTKDSDIVCRRWLLIDVDPIRPTDVSATAEQKQTAQAKAEQVYRYLSQQLRLPLPVVCDSGNGMHLLLRLDDLPNDPQSAWACEQLLQHLGERFTDQAVKIDQTTASTARITALYGTIKAKGSGTAEQPHRLTRIVSIPDPLERVTLQQLLAIVGQPPASQPQQPAEQNGNGSGWNIQQLLDQRQIEYERDDDYQSASGELATMFILPVCPWNEAHDNRAAFIIQWRSGAIAAGCHHDGCTGKGWQQLKEKWGLPAADGITAADIILPQQSAPPQLVQLPALDLPSYISPPLQPQGAFYGPLGKLVQSYAPQTEASAISMLACLLTYYGNALGRRFYVELDGRQFPKLFTCLIGRTAKGRKATADQNAARMMDSISPLAELFRHTGLSTGEGLLKTLLDHKDGLVLRPAVFQEGEFASVIKRKERKGNSLDDVLRNAWDDVALGTSTRADPLRAVGSHVSLVVHITPDELKRLLSACDLTSGFANRFLWIHSQRSQRKPDARGFTVAMAGQQIAALQQTFEQLTAAQADQALEVPLTAQAQADWDDIYRQLDGTDDQDDSGLLEDLCARLPAYLRRLALIYCLADGARAITPEHLQAAWELVEYSRATLDYVYSLVSWADQASQQELIQQRAVRFLQSVPIGQELNRKRVLHEVYQRNRTAKELNQIREHLIRTGQLQLRQQDGTEYWQRTR